MNNRLLAIRPGAIGDCILSFPALESLRDRARYLEVWVPATVVPLVRFADRVRAISSTGLDLVGIPGLDAPPKMLEGFDAIVSWYGANRDEFRMATADLPMEFHKALPESCGHVHAVDFFCAQVETPAKNPRIKIDAPVKRDFIAIHPFSGSPRKNWPHFHELNLKNIEWCATAQNPFAISDDLGKVAEWLAGARLYVGNDSGITHLAAAVGTPVIAIFQASDRRVWAPRGGNVTVVESPSIEEVLEAMLERRFP